MYCTCSPGNIGRGFSVSGFAFKGSATTDFQRPPTHFVRVARWGLPTLYVRWVEVFQAEKNRTRLRLDLAACSKGSHMHSAMIDRLVPDREWSCLDWNKVEKKKESFAKDSNILACSILMDIDAYKCYVAPSLRSKKKVGKTEPTTRANIFSLSSSIFHCPNSFVNCYLFWSSKNLLRSSINRFFAHLQQ